MSDIRIDSSKPLEKLVGDNYGIVRMKLGNIHCMSSVREQLRHVRPRNMRKVPVAIRRGWVLCALECIQQNRGLFLHVVNGR